MTDGSTQVYLLVPRELEAQLLEPLRRHFAGDPDVEVIVERRAEHRRSGVDDRLLRGLAKPGAERRAQVLPRRLPPLPPELEDHAGALRVVQRLTPVRSGLEHLDIEDVMRRAQAGDRDAPTEVYWRTYERVHRRLSMHLPDPHEADRAVKGVYGDVFDRIGEFDPSETQLHTWLDRVVDDHAAQLREPR